MVADYQIASEISATYGVSVPVIEGEEVGKGSCNEGAIGVVRPKPVFVVGVVVAPAPLKCEPNFRDSFDLPRLMDNFRDHGLC